MFERRNRTDQPPATSEESNSLGGISARHASLFSSTASDMDLKTFNRRHPGSKFPALSTVYSRLRNVNLGVDLLLEPGFHDHRDRGKPSIPYGSRGTQ